jgi:cation diffusion facilitator CzcD-associated flavoprotein CzcO
MLVVGFGNTAADVACELAGKAEKVYLSHRHGSIVVSKRKIIPQNSILGFLVADNNP